MSIRGIIMRGAGALAGRKIAEETGNSGTLGTIAGFGLTALARRSPLGLLTVGGLYLGKKYLEGRRSREVQPVLPLEGGGANDLALDRSNDGPGSDAVAAADAREFAPAASA